MEKWAIDRYERPYLVIDDVFLDPKRRSPVIVLGDRSFDLDGLPAAGAEEMVETLSRLREPDSASWGTVRAGEGTAVAWHDVLEQLDNLAMIKDAAQVQEPRLAELEGVVARAARAVREGVGPADVARLSAVLDDGLRHLDWLVHDLLVDVAPDHALPAERAPDPFASRNFFVTTLGLQARYWRGSAPLSLACVWALARRVRSALPGGPPEAGDPSLLALFGRIVEEAATTMYDARDILAHVKCAVTLLLKATASGAQSICALPEAERAPLSGINFLVEAERAASDALAKLGTTQFLQAISDADGAARRRLAMGCYVEEYHVTCRFVEMITPMMAKRLTPDLRRRMFRYFGEEVGHEAFELATCKSLGVDEDALKASLPLPLRSSFVDTFTAIAEHDPVGYLISIFVTEGMLGDKSPLNDLLENIDNATTTFKKAHVKHESLNVELNHSSLSRLMMREISYVSVRGQERALQSLLYLLELNHRGWDEVAEYYGRPDNPAHHGWFE